MDVQRGRPISAHYVAFPCKQSFAVADGNKNGGAGNIVLGDGNSALGDGKRFCYR